MTIHRVEYLIIHSVLEDTEILKNVALDFNLSHAEVIAAATRLFENGDILAEFDTLSGEQVRDGVLSASQIKAHLDGNFSAVYYLSFQGGARWESLCYPNWNRYYKWSFSLARESEITCADREFLEELLRSSYWSGKIPIAETEVWQEIEPWQATYWKTLPKAYRVRYQYKRTSESRFFELHKEQSKLNTENNQRQSDKSQWYAEPELEINPLALFCETALSYSAPIEAPNPRIEYLILQFAIIYDYCELRHVAYSEDLSHAEVAVAADSLFQRGDIRAKVFVDKRDQKGIPNVILTRAGIKDELDGRMIASYYLTSQGGARWESMASPDWSKFLNIENFDCPGQGLLVGTTKNIVEKFLALDCFLAVSYKHIPGTEVWQVLEPWPATYWKTLPRGYQVAYKTHPANFLEEHFKKAFELKEAAPASLLYSHDMARQWRYEFIDKWYRNPFDERIT